MIARLGAALARWCSRWVPDPFVLALGLTLLVFAIGASMLVGQGAELGDAFWDLTLSWAGFIDDETGKTRGGLANPGGLAFALQMCLVLVTGHAMALSPPVQRAIRALAQLPRSAGAATVMVALVACAAALVHWGLGAIAGALLAREIGRYGAERGLRVHYPLLGAAAYSGMAVWHGGLSGSAPLKVAEAGQVGLEATLGSQLNLVVSAAMVITIAVCYWLLTPKQPAELIPPDPNQLAPLPERTQQPVDSAVAWLQESPWVGRTVGAAILAWLAAALATGNRELEINSVNLGFFCIGLLLQGSLRHYTSAIADGARGAGAIILQFPLYFGILGMMKASGIVAAISTWFADIASASSFPVLTYASAGIVNLLVPSGGGQWAVQSEILLGAGQSLGVDPAVTIMAFSYGDAWTNMLQPFWALPLLGIMGLKARDIIGYTAVVFIALGVVTAGLLVAL
ncbi:MAG: TIGR00366 family protein [Deltaproteobacteria bacterium]|nr:TIGR00366 family protein [Deltaproteobacteria bacterium]